MPGGMLDDEAVVTQPRRKSGPWFASKPTAPSVQHTMRERQGVFKMTNERSLFALSSATRRSRLSTVLHQRFRWGFAPPWQMRTMSAACLNGVLASHAGMLMVWTQRRPNGSSAVSRSALLSAPRTWPGVAGPLNDRVDARSVSSRQHDNLAPNDLARAVAIMARNDELYSCHERAADSDNPAGCRIPSISALWVIYVIHRSSVNGDPSDRHSGFRDGWTTAPSRSPAYADRDRFSGRSIRGDRSDVVGIRV